MPVTGIGAGVLPPLELNDLTSARFKDPERIKGAAVQFEAMLIQEMMKSGHAGPGWMGSEDEPGSVLAELAEQQFSQLLAANGGLGIAKLVRDGLAAKPP